MLLTVVILIFVLYIVYHSIRIHQFLKAHDKYIENITKRAKKRKYKTTPLWLNFSYDEIITQQQFDKNMKYFKENRDKNGGFWGIKKYGFNLIAESCTFLGGARAALLQLTHPMIAISVKKHSYIIKNSKSNKNVFKEKTDIMNDCDIMLLSKSLKLRFNRTFAIMFPIIFGPLNISLISAKKAWIVHKTIKGYIQNKDDDEIIGDGEIFNCNTYYKATMVMTVRWVWATLIEGTIFINQLMGNLKYDQQNNKLIEQCYKLSINTAKAFGLRQDQVPPNYELFEEYYYYHMMQSNHIIICNACANWCKVFFIANKWYMKPLIFALQCYTALLFPKIIRNKFNKFDNNLLPLSRFRYFYGLLWLALSRCIYTLLPLQFRYLNDYINMRQRIDQNKSNLSQSIMKTLSGYCANHVVNSFLEG